jgi:archaellum component FlaC
MADDSDVKLDKILDRLDNADKRFDKVDKRLEKVDKKLDRLDGIEADLKLMKHVQGNQSIQLGTIQSDVNGLKTGYRNQVKEVTRLGGLFEDFEHKFAAAAELEN